MTAISRVVGVAGDRLSTRGDQLVRNGTVAHDGQAEGMTVLQEPVTVPKGSVFLMGDNRGNSQDSRFFGPVSLTDVRGRVVSTKGQLVWAFPIAAAAAAMALLVSLQRSRSYDAAMKRI
ncbi:MAG: signal peptidase [Actinomycetia bacterium]|nr:signal peptidase [Actinomycetes bacterium]